MIKKRVISSLLWDGASMALKGAGFANRSVVGDLMQSVRVCDLRQVDELVILDVAATIAGRGPCLEKIRDYAAHCFMPLAVGGGVRTCEDIRDLLKCGADKVVIGTKLFDRVLIQDASLRFGAQAIVAAIDAKGDRVYAKSGLEYKDLTPVKAAKRAVEDGAGEILLTSIPREGSELGFDCDLIRSVSSAVSVPVIASGGAGKYEHLLEAFQAGADAVAVGTGFLYSEMTPQGARKYLREHGVPTRVE